MKEKKKKKPLAVTCSASQNSACSPLQPCTLLNTIGNC